MKELRELIASLEQEATSIQIQGRGLTIEEMARLKAIHQAIPLLREALSLFPAAPTKENLITYKIVSDSGGRLKTAARTSCNFWNRFVVPRNPIVIRLGIFTADSNTIARAYKPWTREGTMYGRVEFNTKFLSDYSSNQIAGTVVHEIGHTLGIGWDAWMDLFDANTGAFNEQATAQLNALQDMFVETDYGPGTQYAHWDEKQFDRELMTGFKDPGEHVLPVTIDIMKVLGHRVVEKLSEKTDLNQLLSTVSQILFTRQEEAKSLDLDFYEETEIFEEIPHPKN